MWPTLSTLLAAGLLALAFTAASAGRNLDFEQGRSGQIPPGWSAPGAPVGGFTVSTSHEMPHGGKACLEIRRETGGKFPVCYVRQTIDATSFRGRRVRLSGWLRFAPSDSEDIPSSARIWIQVGGGQPTFEDLGAHPVRGREWTSVKLICEVGRDADSLTFGAALDGYGRTWVDDLQIREVGPTGAGNQPPRAMDQRATENLIAFGRLLGYVRHFHPSDEAGSIDWDLFAIAGVDEVEDARTSAELRIRLERLFAPIAPTLRLDTKPLPPLTLADLRAGPAPTRIIGWEHRGWPDTYSQIYSERRIAAPAESPGDSILPIGSEVNTGLGGGVWCSIPLTLFLGDLGTVPRGSTRALIPQRPEAWIPTGSDRATRLAAVILFWNAMQHFYPYFDVVGTDWLAQLPEALHAAATDSSVETFEVTLRRLSAKLHDGHVFVRSPYWRYEATSWPFSWSFIEGQLVLVRVDSTRGAGARIGDEVVAIAGRPTSQCVRDAEPLESGATPQRMNTRIARALLSLAVADTISLDLRSSGGAARRVRITKYASVSLTPAKPDSVQEVAPGVMYLDVNRIGDADLLGALPRINAGKGVIFDLRGYPYRIGPSMLGHMTDSTLRSLRWGIPLILRPDHRDTSYAWSDWEVEPASPRIRARVAFLIDGTAISASEGHLGIVEHYRLADLVGEPTAGTTGNVTFVPLPGRFTITFTGMRVLKQDGSRIHGVGILPTVPVSPTVAGIAAGRDEQLERAIAVVGR